MSVKRFLFLVLTAAVCLAGPFFFGYKFTVIRASALEYWYSPAQSSSHSQYLHVLLPATGENEHLCKLLLTSSITGYPDPMFIGWQGRGIFNGQQSHLFKITETLAYLRSFPASMDDEMVLLVDAYDIWMQLRVDVMISRYYDVIAKQNQRLEDQGILGKHHAGGTIRQSIIFGADKLCWPQALEDPACWAVPESDLPENAFGPDTDTDDMFTNRPRWINSGTIMGPVKDVRDLFAATVDMISLKYEEEYEHHSSDQYYFEEVYTEQEINRLRLRTGGDLEAHVLKDGTKVDYPRPVPGKRTEFHITLDYSTDMFQTMAAFDPYLTWMAFNHTTSSPPDNPRRQQRTRRIDEWNLPKDIQRSPLPFSAAAGFDDAVPHNKLWTDVPLGTNTIVNQVFPLYHVTGDKSYRERFWPRMWFHPHAERLLQAEKRRQSQQTDPSVIAVVNGVTWRDPAEHLRLQRGGDGNSAEGKGGAWTTRGAWLPWDELCAKHEDVLFRFDQGGGE